MNTQRQGERLSFQWRPSDRSATTITRYSQEAEHWVKAVREAERKQRKTPISDSLSFINLLFSLIYSLIVIIILLITKVMKWIKS